MMNAKTQPVGQLLRDWRTRRRRSQLDLALEANISTRHLSFLETGRSQPSREMVLHLAEHLEVPLRERNMLLVAAGFAPTYPERPLEDPELQAARKAIDHILTGHEPYPALAVDRHWTLVAQNDAILPLMAGLAPELRQPPINVLRASLHPAGLAPNIVNLAEWRAHVFMRLRKQIVLTADTILMELLAELEQYPGGEPEGRTADPPYGQVAVPLKLATDAGKFTYITTTMLFGTPVDVTLSELALEFFFPADSETAEHCRRLFNQPLSV